MVFSSAPAYAPQPRSQPELRNHVSCSFAVSGSKGDRKNYPGDNREMISRPRLRRLRIENGQWFHNAPAAYVFVQGAAKKWPPRQISGLEGKPGSGKVSRLNKASREKRPKRINIMKITTKALTQRPAWKALT